jgi:hypothetical protein
MGRKKKNSARPSPKTKQGHFTMHKNDIGAKKMGNFRHWQKAAFVGGGQPSLTHPRQGAAR